MAFITGHFTGTYRGKDIGDTKEGFDKTETLYMERVETDRGGRTMRDGIQFGGDCTVRLDYVDYDLIEKGMYDQVAENPGVQQTKFAPMNNVGLLATDLAGELILTPIKDSYAYTLTGGKSYHFYRAIMETDIKAMLSSGLRAGPVTFRCVPAEDVNQNINKPQGAGQIKNTTWELK
jgi:hypothetical protein